MIKGRRIFALLIVNCSLLIFLGACYWEDIGYYGNFDYDLQGTWVSNDPSVFSGTLVITYDTITIRGYSEIQTPWGGNDARRPFRNFTKNIPLNGYSEGGKIFIRDFGTWQDIPYLYSAEGPYPQRKFLRIAFGGRVEILRRQ